VLRSGAVIGDETGEGVQGVDGRERAHTDLRGVRHDPGTVRARGHEAVDAGLALVGDHRAVGGVDAVHADERGVERDPLEHEVGVGADELVGAHAHDAAGHDDPDVRPEHQLRADGDRRRDGRDALAVVGLEVGALTERGRDRLRGRAARQADAHARRDQLLHRLRDRLLRLRVGLALEAQRQVVGDRLRGGAAAGAVEELAAGEHVQVAPCRRGGDGEPLGGALGAEPGGPAQRVEDRGEALLAAHRSTPVEASSRTSRSTSPAIAVRPAPRYLRESTRAGSSSSRDRTAAVNTLLSWVEMLILRMPAATARTSRSSGTPLEPCSTSGTGTTAAIARTRSRSRAAVRSVIACELPTATASRSTPVASANRAASSGSVRTPGACAPSLPPISPISASTTAPAAWPSATTRRVSATFSSHGRVAASIITEEKPSRSASVARAGSCAWSRCSDSGALLASATAAAAEAIGARPPWNRTQFSE